MDTSADNDDTAADDGTHNERTTYSEAVPHEAPAPVPFFPTLRDVLPSSAPSVPAPIDTSELDLPAARDELPRAADALDPDTDDPAHVSDERDTTDEVTP